MPALSTKKSDELTCTGVSVPLTIITGCVPVTRVWVFADTTPHTYSKQKEWEQPRPP